MSDREQLRDADLRLLRHVQGYSGQLHGEDAERVDDILNSLEREGGFEAMTEPQRRMIRAFCHRVDPGYDPEDERDPAERNRSVPRGKEVAVPAVLRNLPKLPPGRRR